MSRNQTCDHFIIQQLFDRLIHGPVDTVRLIDRLDGLIKRMNFFTIADRMSHMSFLTLALIIGHICAPIPV